MAVLFRCGDPELFRCGHLELEGKSQGSTSTLRTTMGFGSSGEEAGKPLKQAVFQLSLSLLEGKRMFVLAEGARP